MISPWNFPFVLKAIKLSHRIILLFSHKSNSTITNVCLFVHLSVHLSVSLQNPSIAGNHHPSSFIIHPSSFIILYHSSFILHHPSSSFIILHSCFIILHSSFLQFVTFKLSACLIYFLVFSYSVFHTYPSLSNIFMNMNLCFK